MTDLDAVADYLKEQGRDDLAAIVERAGREIASLVLDLDESRRDVHWLMRQLALARDESSGPPTVLTGPPRGPRGRRPRHPPFRTQEDRS